MRAGPETHSGSETFCCPAEPEGQKDICIAATKRFLLAHSVFWGSLPREQIPQLPLACSRWPLAFPPQTKNPCLLMIDCRRPRLPVFLSRSVRGGCLGPLTRANILHTSSVVWFGLCRCDNLDGSARSNLQERVSCDVFAPACVASGATTGGFSLVLVSQV